MQPPENKATAIMARLRKRLHGGETVVALLVFCLACSVFPLSLILLPFFLSRRLAFYFVAWRNGARLCVPSYPLFSADPSLLLHDIETSCSLFVLFQFQKERREGIVSGWMAAFLKGTKREISKSRLDEMK